MIAITFTADKKNPDDRMFKTFSVEKDAYEFAAMLVRTCEQVNGWDVGSVPLDKIDSILAEVLNWDEFYCDFDEEYRLILLRSACGLYNMLGDSKIYIDVFACGCVPKEESNV